MLRHLSRWQRLGQDGYYTKILHGLCLEAFNHKQSCTFPSQNTHLLHLPRPDLQAVMELGGTTCTVHQPPSCSTCPIQMHCQAYIGESAPNAGQTSQRVTDYPVKVFAFPLRMKMKVGCALCTPPEQPLISPPVKQSGLAKEMHKGCSTLPSRFPCTNIVMLYCFSGIFLGSAQILAWFSPTIAQIPHCCFL